MQSEEDQDREFALARRYEAMSDEQLLGLYRDADGLTDIARDLLQAEIRSRRLTLTPSHLDAVSDGRAEVFANSSHLPRGERQLWYAKPGDYAELASPSCVFPIGDKDDVHAIRVTLALADIPTDEFWPAHADRRGPFFAVMPEDAERARILLSQPVSRRVEEQMAEELADSDDWSPPDCPTCHMPNALLTSVAPTNQWLCEECGHTWRSDS